MPPLEAHGAGHPASDEAEHAAEQRAAVAIELLMATQDQPLQLLDQLAAVAAGFGNGELLAELAVGGREGVGLLRAGLATLERVQLRCEFEPARLMQAFECGLLHAAPISERAMP